jgi:hypothetical protein
MGFVDWFLTTVSSATLIGFAAWLLKGVITARLTRAVQFEFDKKLEGLRADIQSKEAQIQALRNGALTALVSRQAAVDSRRLQAVDQLWAAFNALAPARTAATWMSVLNVDYVMKRAVDDPKVREYFGMFGVVDLNALFIPEAWKARPHVSRLAWALFEAYRAIVTLAVTKLHMLQKGIDVSLVDHGRVADLVTAAMPEKVIDAPEMAVLTSLLDELETKLLHEFTRMLAGEEADMASVKQADAIVKAARKLNEGLQNAEQTEAQFAN